MKRDVDLFVSRLHPSTTDSDIIDTVCEILGKDYTASTVCSKLNSKYTDLYSSFHICINVSLAEMRNVIDILNAPESWPSGVLVRRYFKPKNDQ